MNKKEIAYTILIVGLLGIPALSHHFFKVWQREQQLNDVTEPFHYQVNWTNQTRTIEFGPTLNGLLPLLYFEREETNGVWVTCLFSNKPAWRPSGNPLDIAIKNGEISNEYTNVIISTNYTGTIQIGTKFFWPVKAASAPAQPER